MRIYIAGASVEIARAERAIKAVRELGSTITHDWTISVRANGGPGKEGKLSREEQAKFASEDLSGVERCELFWYLLPDPLTRSEGAAVEFGYAQGLMACGCGPKLVMLSGNREGRIFCAARAFFWYASDEEAISRLATGLGW